MLALYWFTLGLIYTIERVRTKNRDIAQLLKTTIRRELFLFDAQSTISIGAVYMDFKGSQTEKNLLAAFAGESQARTRYTFFASVAKKEGY